MVTQNPNQRAITFSTGLLIVSLICTAAGFTILEGDVGFWTGALGAVALLVAAILLPVFWFDGQKKTRELSALIGGDSLLAHWQYGPDEWHRYVQQEHTRAMANLRKNALWTFLITNGMLLIGGLFGGEGLDTAFVLLLVGIGVGITALIVGMMYMGAQMAYRRNRGGTGEVWVGLGGVYFLGQYYSWAARGVQLTSVLFQPGNPAIIQFRYDVAASDSAQSHDVRVPVPMGREMDAQALVSRFYEGG